jgi:hypothetical protein
MRHVILFGLLMLPLSACAQGVSSSPEMPPVATMPTASDKTCQLPDLVGKPETVLHTMRFGNVVRFIHPGDAVTMDYAPQRTNIEINDKGIIARVYCG